MWLLLRWQHFFATSKEVKNVLFAFPPFATTIFGLRLSRNFTRILAPFATSLVGVPPLTNGTEREVRLLIP